MQSVSSRIWTRVAVSISNDDNHYTMGTYSKRYQKEWIHKHVSLTKTIYILFYEQDSMYKGYKIEKCILAKSC